ncbi:cell cycle regulator of non-homologous end joining [Melopsittacus undulatus]|uniref:cell cycle regulator of non-homologous end joining n=1 Tax=Melopsittacus undulatus TaxID=13146 RepID=UPI00146F1EBD|nr:cell cycle regulator of non-homologous end joining [Melopsittacus undulatus]
MAEAAPRRRLLPAWMRTAGDDGPAAVAPVPATRRRKAAARPRVAAVHCMNEAELVNVALAVLAEKLQREEEGEKACSRREEEQELQPASGQAPGNTAGTGGGSDRSPTLPSPPGAGADAERTGWEDSQSDVLKYVREIFFS